jgi:tyrosyl-tRNA synthetase
MMTMDRVMENTKAISEQVKRLLNFNESSPNHAILVNNYDWVKGLSFLDFEREVGSHISVNAMLAKESVKRRIEREGCGISHMEFSYMLIQAYDFYHLYNTMGCKIQMAGNDQQSNCGLGVELIHKKLGKDDAAAFFWPLLTNADGSKIGKTSGGKNVWLDAEKTSTYSFYQYFLNVSDLDAERFIKAFTLIPLDEINAMIEKHRENPSRRYLQKELAKYMTCLVHSEDEYNKAVEASEILFGNGTTEQLGTIDDATLMSAMSGVNVIEITKEQIDDGITVVDLANMHDKISSKSEARKLIKANGFSINKTKVTNEKEIINQDSLINGKYLLLQKGKKEYNLVCVK